MKTDEHYTFGFHRSKCDFLLRSVTKIPGRIVSEKAALRSQARSLYFVGQSYNSYVFLWVSQPILILDSRICIDRGEFWAPFTQEQIKIAKKRTYQRNQPSRDNFFRIHFLNLYRARLPSFFLFAGVPKYSSSERTYLIKGLDKDKDGSRPKMNTVYRSQTGKLSPLYLSIFMINAFYTNNILGVFGRSQFYVNRKHQFITPDTDQKG